MKVLVTGGAGYIGSVVVEQLGQQGETLGLPHSRPMPTIGVGCHELRIPDRSVTWRIVYHVAGDAVVILDVFAKKTEATPQGVLATCRRRLTQYHAATKTRTRR